MPAGGTAFLACETCHARKQRCDVPDGGGACSNCHALGVECVPRRRKARARKRSSPFSPVGRSGLTDEENKKSRLNAGLLEQRSSATIDPDNSIYVGLDRYSTSELSISLPKIVPVGRESTGLYSEAENRYLQSIEAFKLPSRPIREGLLTSFFDRVLPWCPVLTAEEIESLKRFELPPILNNSILLAGAMVSTASGRQDLVENLLVRVKALLHCRPNELPTTFIKAFLFLAWCNLDTGTLVSMDGSNLWHSQMIALTFQCGLHREPPTSHPRRHVRRRLWYAVFARDCICGATTGRPRYINPEDSDVRQLGPADLDSESGNPSHFLQHVELCLLLGNVTQQKVRGTLGMAANAIFLGRLKQWCEDLPPELQIYDTASLGFCAYDRNNMQLHVLYLACVISLLLPENKRASPSSPVLLAAGLIAGIYEEMMSRGDAQLLPGFFVYPLLAAGHALVVCRERQNLWCQLEPSLSTIKQALQDQASRYSAAAICRAWLTRMLEKAATLPDKSNIRDLQLPMEYRALFWIYGPKLCSWWNLTAPDPELQYPTPSGSQVNDAPPLGHRSSAVWAMPGTVGASLSMDGTSNDVAMLSDAELWSLDRQQIDSFIGDWLCDDWNSYFGELPV